MFYAVWGASCIADLFGTGCAWIGEIKDRNKTENRPKYVISALGLQFYLQCFSHTENGLARWTYIQGVQKIACNILESDSELKKKRKKNFINIDPEITSYNYFFMLKNCNLFFIIIIIIYFIVF